MKTLLALAAWIDRLTDACAVLAKWSVIAACAISAANAIVRYAFDYSSNAYLEIQWYLFAVCVMFGAAQVLRVNEHVRVDVLYGMYPTRTKVYVDLGGLVVFLLPAMLTILWLALPLTLRMVESGEHSSSAGGLIRWPAMATIPIGCTLVALQGLAEIVKRIGWLLHVHEMDTHYERPLQ